jgi:hypothetical protein
VKVRFQADADLKYAIVVATKRYEPAIDFQSAQEAGLEGVQDPDVLSMAARDGRVLVSHDRRTMPYHFAEFISVRASPGLIIISQRMPISAVVEDLFLIWSATEADAWVNQIRAIPL